MCTLEHTPTYRHVAIHNNISCHNWHFTYIYLKATLLDRYDYYIPFYRWRNQDLERQSFNWPYNLITPPCICHRFAPHTHTHIRAHPHTWRYVEACAWEHTYIIRWFWTQAHTAQSIDTHIYTCHVITYMCCLGETNAAQPLGKVIEPLCASVCLSIKLGEW